jgi:N-acyl-D-amino-acid deacylase
MVLFDSQTVTDRATAENPRTQASGVKNVWVNGRAALLDGIPTGALAGRRA